MRFLLVGALNLLATDHVSFANSMHFFQGRDIDEKSTLRHNHWFEGLDAMNAIFFGWRASVWRGAEAVAGQLRQKK